MNLSIGIVGLPNVGKSTLFNALLKKQQAFVANYPFATIEPNIGVVPVPDERLLKLKEIVEHGLDPASPVKQANSSLRSSVPIIPATVFFVDIAGLVKGAAEGQGLGNKFLSHIREVDAIVQVVRHFKDSNVIRSDSSIDAKNDFEVVNAELILADLETLGKQVEPRKNVTKEDLLRWEVVKKLRIELDKGILAKDVSLTVEEKFAAKDLHLLTAKPMFVIANVDEQELRKDLGEDVIAVCAKIESELSELSEEEQEDYLKSLGVEQSGLERVIKEGYKILDLISYLTCGEKEVRAWTIKKGSTALLAAGEIHTDFMKKFIKAEVTHYKDFVEFNGWKGAREHGRALLEGKDYVMQDGDVVEFKIGA